MFVFCGIRFCTDMDSPEVVLTFIVPVILIYYSLINGIEPRYVAIYSVILGAIIYFSLTVLKNGVAWYMNTEDACKITQLQ